MTNTVKYDGKIWNITALDLNRVRLSRLVEEGAEITVTEDLNLKGIVLTEKLLEDYMFENTRELDRDNDVYGIWSRDGFVLYQDFWDSTEFLFATYMKNGEFKGGVSIQYLHELQNLYIDLYRKRLSRKDEEI